MRARAAFAFLFASASALLWPLQAAAQEGGWPDLGTPVTVAADGSKDAAVIVGIDEYAFVAHVAGATHNATDWLTYLTESRHVPIDRVHLLRDVQGTREAILKAASQAAQEVQAGGTLWFVFIGHGAPAQEGNDGLLVGADAQQSADSIFSRSVSQGEILTRLAVGPASAHRVLVVDACFSGRSASGEALAAGLQPMLAVREAPVAGAVVLSAGASDQFAGPLPGAARPAFSYLVLGALRGWAADASGNVTADGAVAYSRQVLRTLPIGRLQEPRVAGSPGGYVLAKRATEKAPNLHDIVIRPAEPTPTGPAIPTLPFFTRNGVATADEGPRVPGALHATFTAPLGDPGVWTLRDGHGTVCKLPCTHWVVPSPGYLLVRESPLKGEAEVKVPLPAESQFKEGADVNEQLVPPKGSMTTGIVVTSISVAAGAGGAVLIYYGSQNLGGTSDNGIWPLLGGTTLATLGLLGILYGIPVMAGSHDWRVDASAAAPVVFQFNTHGFEMTHGTTQVSLAPCVLSGVF